MRARSRIAVTLAVVSAAAWSACTAAVSRQPASYTAPRTADGVPDLNGVWQALNTANYDIQSHPARPAPAIVPAPPRLGAPGLVRATRTDLQGVWRYEGAIPLERPAQLAGRTSLTAAEVEQRQQIEKEQAAKRLAGYEGAAVGRRSVAESPIRGNEYNSFWQDHGRPRQVSNRTSLIVDPPDGRLPYTPEAKKAEARGSALWSGSFRIVSGSGYWRALPHRRCHRHDVAGAQRRPQPNRAESGLRDHPPRGVSRSPCDSGRWVRRRGCGGLSSKRFARQWTLARNHPAVVWRRVRPMGRRHACRRYHELHRPDQLRVGEHLGAAVRVAASCGAPQADRREYARVHHHRRRPCDVCKTVDGRDSNHQAAGRHTDLRVRLS